MYCVLPPVEDSMANEDPYQELVLDTPNQKIKNKRKIHTLYKKQTKLRIVSSDRVVYLQYHDMKVAVQVAYSYSIAVNQVSIPFL